MLCDLLIRATVVGLIVIVGSVFGLSASARAEGIIYQLPDDGAWVSFKVSGKANAPDGAVMVTIEGTQTLRSVGRTAVENKHCRWIELESDLTFQRKGGQPAAFKEIVKLLIPEAYLVKGENPRGHVLKAFKGDSAETIKELDVKGKDAGEIQGLDELFHAPLKQVSALTPSDFKTKNRNWTCEGLAGKSDENGTVFTTETRINKDAPFGVVMYRCEKERQRNVRTMEWQLIDFGKDATSAAPNATADPCEELETAIPEAIRLLEFKDYANFIKKFLSPAEFKEITEKAGFNEAEFAKQFGDKRAPGLLVILKSIKGQTPTLDQSKKIATYEFKTEGGGLKKISMAKIDKHWCIQNKPQ